MAVTMSNVKQIMHNNKEVIKIEDSLGHILWQKKKTIATINITVGEKQDYQTNQYPNRLVLPSLTGIRSKVASKIGTSADSINVKKVEMDWSTVYWYNADESFPFPRVALTAENPSFFGIGNGRTRTGLYNWSTEIQDITDKLSSGRTTAFYGYVWDAYSGEIRKFSSSSSYGWRFCSSSSSSNLPTFTIIVTYES